MEQVDQGYQPRAVRPSTVHIKARNLKFALDTRTPHHWCDQDPFLTHFMNAMSLTFPAGERQFIESVKAVRNRVKNPATRADVAGFSSQEALHSREHAALNELLQKMGYPVAEIERRFGEVLQQQGARQSKQAALANTVAIEHLTALMGRALLGNQELIDKIHPDLRAMWMWHGLEELEHKAVAFDVYQEVFGNYVPRALALMMVTTGVFAFAHYVQFKLLRHEGRAYSPSTWIKGLWGLYGPRGVLAPCVPGWLSYFRPDFHPWQDDDSALVARVEARLRNETRALSPS